MKTGQTQGIERLGLGVGVDLGSWMEKLQGPESSLCLLYTVE